MRRLLISNRTVASHSHPSYGELWKALERAVTAAGGHAWHFRHIDEPDRVIEFVEYDASADIIRVAAVAAARDALEILSASTASGLWDEWRE